MQTSHKIDEKDTLKQELQKTRIRLHGVKQELRKKQNLISGLKKELRAKETRMGCWEKWIGDLQEEIRINKAQIRNLTHTLLINSIFNKNHAGFYRNK
jgi:predicted  nucleic acid-binding Zn-ribbon protein